MKKKILKSSLLMVILNPQFLQAKVLEGTRYSNPLRSIVSPKRTIKAPSKTVNINKRSSVSRSSRNTTARRSAIRNKASIRSNLARKRVANTIKGRNARLQSSARKRTVAFQRKLGRGTSKPYGLNNTLTKKTAPSVRSTRATSSSYRVAATAYNGASIRSSSSLTVSAPARITASTPVASPAPALTASAPAVLIASASVATMPAPSLTASAPAALTASAPVAPAAKPAPAAPAPAANVARPSTAPVVPPAVSTPVAPAAKPAPAAPAPVANVARPSTAPVVPPAASTPVAPAAPAPAPVAPAAPVTTAHTMPSALTATTMGTPHVLLPIAPTAPVANTPPPPAPPLPPAATPSKKSSSIKGKKAPIVTPTVIPATPVLSSQNLIKQISNLQNTGKDLTANLAKASYGTSGGKINPKNINPLFGNRATTLLGKKVKMPKVPNLQNNPAVSNNNVPTTNISNSAPAQVVNNSTAQNNTAINLATATTTSSSAKPTLVKATSKKSVAVTNLIKQAQKNGVGNRDNLLSAIISGTKLKKVTVQTKPKELTEDEKKLSQATDHTMANSSQVLDHKAKQYEKNLNDTQGAEDYEWD